MRRALTALLVALGIATLPVVHSLDLRDDRLPADQTERLLKQKLGASDDFDCEEQDEDASLGLADSDYFCSSARTGYWVGTDENRITGVQPAG
jgi:hypothetical protein